jgi:hypothetical protein
MGRPSQRNEKPQTKVDLPLYRPDHVIKVQVWKTVSSRDARSRNGDRLAPLAMQNWLPEAGMGSTRNDGAAPTKQQPAVNASIHCRGWGRNAFQQGLA